MKQRLASWWRYAKTHKLKTILVVVVICIVYYWASSAFAKTNTETRYVLGTATQGTIISAVSGSGQVVAADQIDIKPKVSGEITWIGVNPGDAVRAGQAIAQIDDTDAKQAVEDAEQSLTQAKLQYQKDAAQAPIDYQNSLSSLDQAKTDLTTTYNDTFNTLSDTYLALPAVMTAVQNILHGYDLSSSKNQWNVDVMRNIFTTTDEYNKIGALADMAEKDYATAHDKYATSLDQYKTLTRYSDATALETSLTGSTDTVTAIAQAFQSTINLIDTLTDLAQERSVNLSPTISSLRSTAQSNLSTVNSKLSALLSQQKSLDAAKKAITNDEQSIKIYQIGNPDGSNPISLQSSSYNISDQERKLDEQKADLADYTVTAPFAGMIASVASKVSDQGSTGTTIATLISSEQYAQLSLNEIDTAKIKVGDKATLTFDAIDGLTLTGTVADIDAVGTVSQGVVSYTIKIRFDAQDARVKPGMSVNANIISDVTQNVLTVPQTAIKTQGGQSFVQVFNPPLGSTGGTAGVTSTVAPQSVPVQTGASDNANTEITSGLTEGEQIVVRTIAATTGTTGVQSQSQTPTILNAAGVRTGGTGAAAGGGGFRGGGGFGGTTGR